MAENTEAQPRLVDLTEAPGVQNAIVTEGQGHFPVIDKTPDDRAAVVLRGGGGHINIGGRLDLFFSEDGLKWYGKRTAVDTCADDRNPAFGITPKGRFMLGFHFQASYNGEGIYQPEWNLARDMQVFSDDDGLHWSRFANLKLGDVESHSPYGRIIRQVDGTYLQNVYGAHAPAVPNMPATGEGVGDYAYVVRSRDEGATWGDPSLIAAGHNETALLALKDGSLLAAARSEGDQHLDLYRSEDKGYTWKSLVQATGASQHPADLVGMGNGQILLVFGNRQKDTDIRAILSRDSGKTWDIETHLRLTRPLSGDFGYPSAVMMGEKLLVVYYWAGDPPTYYDGSRAQCRAALIPISEILKKR
ncbi:MAG: exo-alpha-sialidase [Armatimonadetes bacterium]|nr:exo-alpha-sialidase [Armatimonadota bacterium]